MTSVHEPLEEAEEQTQAFDEQAASRQGAGTRAGARAREVLIVALRGTLEWLRTVLVPGVRAAVSSWWAREKTAREKAAPDPRRSSLWSQAPASPADLWAYTKSGAWVPGERASVLEALGKAYGCFAVTVSVLLYSAAWVLQRPTRLAALIGFLLVLRLSWSA